MATTKIDKAGKRWRVRVISNGRCVFTDYRATRAKAEKLRDEARAELAGETIETLVDDYLDYLANEGHRGRPSSEPHRARTGTRLRAIYGKALSQPTTHLSPKRAGNLYRDFRLRETRTGRPPSNTEQLNTLAQAKSHGRWMVEVGRRPSNPWEAVKPIGVRKAGRPQLTIDESRELFKVCIEEASEGSTAVLMALCLGLGASEIVERVVRDLDDNGSVLIVPKGKTKNRVRRVKLDFLGPILVARAEGKPASTLLFERNRHWVLRNVKRLCKKAGVTIVDAHGLRGTQGTVSMEAGATVELVAKQLGHGGTKVTRDHYIAPGAEENQRQGQFLRVLNGGILGPRSPDGSPKPESDQAPKENAQ